MTQLNLSREEFTALYNFCKEHNLETWFFGKDQGAYIGAAAGEHSDNTFKNKVFYFDGCNPKKDADFWENAQAKFGSNDFSVDMDISLLEGAVSNPNVTKLLIKVNKGGSVQLLGVGPKKAA